MSANLPFGQKINFQLPHFNFYCIPNSISFDGWSLTNGQGDGGQGGHEGDRMNKEEEVVGKSILTMLMELF